MDKACWALEFWWILWKQRVFGITNAMELLATQNLVNSNGVAWSTWLINYGSILSNWISVFSYQFVISYRLFGRTGCCLRIVMLLKWVVVLIDRHGFAYLKRFCRKYFLWTVLMWSSTSMHRISSCSSRNISCKKIKRF